MTDTHESRVQQRVAKVRVTGYTPLLVAINKSADSAVVALWRSGRCDVNCAMMPVRCLRSYRQVWQ